MPNLGGWEWVIILVIVLLLFGVGRLSKLGEELGKGVRSFREGVSEGSSDDASKGTSKEASEEAAKEPEE